MADILDTLKKINYTNIDQFEADINHNFAVIQNSPLYKGIPGKEANPGLPGLPGIRGSKFVFVNYDLFNIQFPNELLNSSKITLEFLNTKIVNFTEKQKLLAALELVELVDGDIIVLTNSMMINYNQFLDLFLNTGIAFNEQINLISTIESQIAQYVQFYINQNPTILSLKNIFESYTTYAKNYIENSNTNITTQQTPSSVYVPYYPGLTSNTNGILVNHKYFGFNDTEFSRDNNGTIVFGSLKKYIDLLEATFSLSDGETLTSDYAPGASNSPVAIFLQDTPNAGILIGKKSGNNLRRFASIYKNTLDELVIKSDAGPDSALPSLDFSKLIISKSRMTYDKKVDLFDNLSVSKDFTFLGNINSRFIKSNEFVGSGVVDTLELGDTNESTIKLISDNIKYSQFVSNVLVNDSNGLLSKEYFLETSVLNPLEESALVAISNIPNSNKKIVTSNYLGFIMRKLNNISIALGSNGNYWTKEEFESGVIPKIVLNNWLESAGNVYLGGNSDDNLFKIIQEENFLQIGKSASTQIKFISDNINFDNYDSNVLVTNAFGKLLKTFSIEISTLNWSQTSAYTQITPISANPTKVVTSNYLRFLIDKINNLNITLPADYYKKTNFVDGTIQGLLLTQYLEARGNIYLGGDGDINLLEIHESANTVKIGRNNNSTTNIFGDVFLESTPNAVLVTGTDGKISPAYSLATSLPADTVPDSYANVPVETSAPENLIPSNVGTRSPLKVLTGLQNKWIINTINSIKTRLKNTFNKTESDTRYLQVSNNLSELSDLVKADLTRTNLSVYSKTESDTNYFEKTENFNDVPDKSLARTNLDVYSKSESGANIGSKLVYYAKINGYTNPLIVQQKNRIGHPATIERTSEGLYKLYFRHISTNAIISLTNKYVLGNSLDGGSTSPGGVVSIRKCAIENMTSPSPMNYGQIEISCSDDASRNDCIFEIFIFEFLI